MLFYVEKFMTSSSLKNSVGNDVNTWK